MWWNLLRNIVAIGVSEIAGRDVTHYEPASPINHIIVDKNLKQQIMIIAMPAVDVKDPDYYAALLVAVFLAIVMALDSTGTSFNEGWPNLPVPGSGLWMELVFCC